MSDADDSDGVEDSADATGSKPVWRRVPWRSMVRVVGVLVLLAVVVPFVVYAVPQVVGAEESYVALSGSMEPAVSPGDVVVVEAVDPSAIEEGDIVTFRRGDEPVPTTHRVTDVVEQDGTRMFETKGDANEDPDQSLVGPDQLKGRVMSVGGYPFVIPLIGHVIQFANTQLGFALLFVAPFLLLATSGIWGVVSSASARARKESDSGHSEASTSGTKPDGDSSDGSTDERQEEDAGDEDATDPDDGSETTGGDGDEAETAVSLSASELRLGLAILAVFLAYSAWVAYATFTFWAFSVAAGAATGFVLLAGIYVAGKRSADAAVDEAASDDPATDVEKLHVEEDLTGPAATGELFGSGTDDTDAREGPVEISWGTSGAAASNGDTPASGDGDADSSRDPPGGRTDD